MTLGHAPANPRSPATGTALGLVLGYALDALLGDPRRAHPVAAFGRLAARVEGRTYAPSHGRGVAHVGLLVGGAALLGIAAERLTPRPVARVLVTGAATWSVLGGRSLCREAEVLAGQLDRGDLAAARVQVTHLVGRDPSRLDADELARACVESVAENTSDAVVAPLLWGAVAGVPGLLAYRAANTLDAMVGHRSPRYLCFGWAAARLDDVLNLAPARLAGLLAALAAPLVGGSPATALGVVRRDAGRHPSPNAGVVEAAFAGRAGGPARGRQRLRGPGRGPRHPRRRPRRRGRRRGAGGPALPSDLAALARGRGRGRPPRPPLPLVFDVSIARGPAAERAARPDGSSSRRISAAAPVTVLLLGGTGEARALAALLVADGVDVLSSLAGRVSRPALPVGRVRVGGFGGVDGFAVFLVEHHVTAVVDATHPFAATISANAAVACARTGTPLLRLTRPGWANHADAGRWTWVDAAGDALTVAGDRPVLTTGRQSLAAFLPWADRAVLARVVDPPELELPPTWRLIRSRGPYELAGERALLLEHRADLLVTKDSGGTLTVAKLDAARELDVPVVVIRRPPAQAGVPAVPDVPAARRWVARATSGRSSRS